MKRIKNHLGYIALILPLLLALVCVVAVSLGSHQASLPIPMPQEFIGEYSYDGENWLPLTENAALSALDGDLLLRGHFVNEVEEGLRFNFYRNHIGVSVSVNGERVHQDDVTAHSELDTRLFASMCAQEWMYFISPGITVEDTVEIRLYNPHHFGNQTAYRDFLTTLCVDAPGWNLLELNLDIHGEPFRIAGGLLAIASLMLLGAAIAAVVVHVPVGGVFLKLGLLTLFAGGFIIFDTLDISFWNELNVLNTYAKQLCMMLAVLCMDQFLSDALTGRRQRIAKAAALVSALLDSVLIVLSFTGMTVMFDTLPIWAASQLILCPLLMICCVSELRSAPKERRLVPLSALVMFAAILLDFTGVGATIVWRSPCSKIVFVALFAVYIVAAARGIMKNYRATIRAAKLEKELEDSRIAIMLSQIKPHFLYNVLNTIYHLYGKEPQTAQEAVSSFAEYLRCNMLSIEKSEVIPFREEYRHIQTYLSLEQIRFRGKLDVIYDIEVTDFRLPPLTVEPLVENAVKHGVTKKRGGGTVTISTRKAQDAYVITVADTGVGFDPEHYADDGKPHIGIRNVRERLHSMVGGTLSVTSTPDGTIAVVTIPNKEANGRNEDHSG